MFPAASVAGGFQHAGLNKMLKMTVGRLPRDTKLLRRSRRNVGLVHFHIIQNEIMDCLGSGSFHAAWLLLRSTLLETYRA
jgi:hypothetical protein